MSKKIALAILVSATFISSAQAVDVTPPGSAAPLNTLAPSAGDAQSVPNGKVNYDTMTRAEKLKLINDRHNASKAKAEAKWKGMTDDQKLAQFEKRHNSFMARRAAKTQTNTAAASTPVQSLAPAAGTANAPSTGQNQTKR